MSFLIISVFGCLMVTKMTTEEKMGLKNEEYNPKTILLEELKRLSKEYGLGDIYFTTEYDETGYPEKLFVIKVPEYKSVEDANYAHFKIIDEIESFSKKNDSQVFEFFRNSYIVLEFDGD